jgi:hypothetical protein
MARVPFIAAIIALVALPCAAQQQYYTRPFGPGTLTTTPGGQSYYTRPFGGGTLTTTPSGQTFTSRPFGSGTLTTTPSGQTFHTRPFGSGTIINRVGRGGFPELSGRDFRWQMEE